jgi:hypothetical protein
MNVLLKKKDIPKFNGIIEQMGLVKDDVSLSEFQVDAVKESVKTKLERCAEKAKQSGRGAKTAQKEIVNPVKEVKPR